MVCSLDGGLQCLASWQGKGGRCHDYKIRYYCQCDETTQAPTRTSPVMIWTTPAAHLPVCHEGDLISLLDDVPDSAFVATSSASSRNPPHQARLGTTPDGDGSSWKAAKADLHQYIQVDLGSVRPVYALQIGGNPDGSELVTSLFVLYSSDDVRYSYVEDADGRPRLFRGPLAHSGSQRVVLARAVEARFVRLEPQTWKHGIAMQFDVFGCDQLQPASPPALIRTTPAPAVDTCADQMGMENGLLTDRQVTATSIRSGPAAAHGHGGAPRLGGRTSWRPSLNSRKEHVTVDFLEPRNLSGVVTQGHADLDMWIESFVVRYSTDGVVWSNIVNEEGEPRILAANVDRDTPHTNSFERLVGARYLQIVPHSVIIHLFCVLK